MSAASLFCSSNQKKHSVSEIDEGMSKAEEEENSTELREIQVTNESGNPVTVVMPVIKPVDGLTPWLKGTALETVQRNFAAMVEAITKTVVTKGHTPSMKFMLDMAARADYLAGISVPTEETAEGENRFSVFLWDGGE